MDRLGNTRESSAQPGCSDVLVTGGAGFLGRFVLGECSRRGLRTTVLGRNAGNKATNLIADLEQGHPNLGSRRVHAVFHLAGLAHTSQKTKEDRARFYSVNLDGTRNLLAALESLPELPESLVFASTVAVYGLDDGQNLSEETPRRATDAYGRSKAEAEDLIRDWGAGHSVRVGIARLPLVAGPDPPGNLGAMLSALSRGRYLRIGDGSARRSVVLARDAARGLFEIAERGGVFHLTDGHNPSFRQLEEALRAALGCKVVRSLPLALAVPMARAGDLASRVLRHDMPLTTPRLRKMTRTFTVSDQKARRAFGWDASRVVDAAGEIVG